MADQAIDDTRLMRDILQHCVRLHTEHGPAAPVGFTTEANARSGLVLIRFDTEGTEEPTFTYSSLFEDRTVQELVQELADAGQKIVKRRGILKRAWHFLKHISRTIAGSIRRRRSV